MTKARLFVLFVVAGLFVWMFAEAVFSSGVFVFRDSGHFYYPLFKFVQGEWLAGRVPLWNPYENLGVPLAGNATASVFYPGKLLFFLPLGYSTCYTWYIMAHVLLAAWTAYRLAREFGASVEAGGVAALSYAFSGNVLYQYCNVIFLVGAAWLPLAVLAAHRMLNKSRPPRSRFRWAASLGLVLAMMTLGGNAEMAYHAGLLAAFYAFWLWRSGNPLPEGEGGRRLATSRPVILAAAALVAFALSAVQVLPSAEFTRRSGRAASSVPRSIYELPSYLAHSRPSADSSDGRWSDGFTCRTFEPGTHYDHVYHFSVGPWRLAEYLWPNVSGRQFPIHRRWLDVVPAEGRIWVPSLYMGLIPLVLAVASMRFSVASGRVGWLSWVVVLAVVASFGWYGLGWLAAELRGAVGADMTGPWLVGGPFGGLYWLANVLLPGYVYFRYPAKLMVIAALGLSMLAAAGWDRAFAGPATRLRRGIVWLAAVSVAGAVVAVAIWPFWAGWFAELPANVMFGPFDAAGAHRDLLIAFVQTALVASTFWWLLGRSQHGARWTATAALALVALDLAVANSWMIQCAPASLWRRQRALSSAITHHQQTLAPHPSSLPAPTRTYRQRIWLPPSWQKTSSPERLVEAARWDSATIWPKYNLAPKVPLAEVFGTMSPYDYEAFLAALGKPPFVREDGQTSQPLTNVRYFILRGGEQLEGGHAISLTDQPEQPEDVSLWYYPEHLPRAWIVHDVEVVEPVCVASPREIAKRTKRVFASDGRARNLLQSALVETGQAPGPIIDGEADRADDEQCVVTHVDPLCVEIDARLSRPGLVVLYDQYYPGWQCQVETNGRSVGQVPVLRTNRVMRGAWLPAGKHRLTYRYRPRSFWVGATVSALAWIALIGFAVVGWWTCRRCR